MSKCPISWNVHVETGHNFFITQEAFNKYNKAETYEEKIAKRHALFPLQQSHIGVNPDSKRSLKKPAKEIVTKIQKVQSLSDESDDDEIFGATSADLDEFGIGPPVVLKKEEKKTWKRKSNPKDVVLKHNVKTVAGSEKTTEDTEQAIISSEIDIGELEEFGVDKSVPRTDKGLVGGKTSKDEFVAEKKRKQKKSVDLEKDIVNEEELPITHTYIDAVGGKTNEDESVDEKKSVDLEKDIVNEGELLAENKIQTEHHVEHQEEIHDNIEDLEEFGVAKNSLKSGNKREETIQPAKDKIEGVDTKEKNKTFHEEFPWDTKYRESRKSEKFDLYKYQNRKSSLTSREQVRYLAFHSRFGFNTPRNPSQKVKNEIKEFSGLHERVAEEQKEFQQYLERLAQTMRAEYNYLAPEADRYYKERIALKRKRVNLYPKYYNVCDKLNLSTIGPPCQLVFVRSLLEMGTVPKLMLPSMEIGERPRIPIDYDSIAKHCPCVHSKSSNIWNHEPCSQDQNCAVLSKQHRVHITISASAIACLVNNHAPNYNREWEIPFTVRDYQLQEGEQKFMHRVVYIDNPLPAKELTGRDKNTTFYKYALRSHMGRFNQKGHVFSANQKGDQDHQEASELPRQQSSAEQSHGLSSAPHRQESDIPFLSPLKSPPIRKEQKKKGKIKTKDEVTEEEEDDPFGTMDVSMEDLETFGTDLSQIKKSKNVDQTHSSLLDHVHSNQEKEVEDNTHDKVSKHSEKEAEKQLREASKEVSTTISNKSDANCMVEFDKNEDDNKNTNISFTNFESRDNEESVILGTVSNPVQGLTERSKEVTKPVQVETEHVQEIAKLEQGVTKHGQEVTNPEQEVTQPEQEVTQHGQEVSQPEQEVTKPGQEVTKPEQEVTQHGQEVSQPEQEVTKPGQEVTQPEKEVKEPEQEESEHVQDVTQPARQLTKPAQEVTQPAQEVTQPAQELTQPAQDATKPAQDATKPVQEVPTHVQEVTKPAQEVSTHVQEVTKPVQEETELTKDVFKPILVVKKPEQAVTGLKLNADYNMDNNTSNNSFELQMSSASDEESDALIIDEPEEVKGRNPKSKLSIEETPASPIQVEVCIEAPASPLPDTPLSPTKIGNSPNTGSAFTIPISPSKQTVKSDFCSDKNSIDNTDIIMSPERTDRSSPTSPVKYSTPFGQPCKIIPLQRESEEENVIDNSNIITYQESRLFETSRNIGLRPKRRRSVKKPLTDSDSGDLGKLNTSKQFLGSDLKASTTCVSSVDSDSKHMDDLDKNSVTGSLANEDQKSKQIADCVKKTLCLETDSSSHIETPKLLQDSGESSDEVVSPRSKIYRKNKKSRSDSDFLSPRRRPRVIDSDSDIDDQTSGKMDTELEKGENSELINENIDTRGPSVSAQGKRNRRSSTSTDNEINKEQNKQSNLPSQRKRQKSGKGQSPVENLVTDFKIENIEEMACMRRKTRSIVGTRKKDKLFESKEIPEKISLRSRTKSLDDVTVVLTTETVSMTTRRQTRQSVDSVFADDEKRSNKLAILDRVKKSLRLTSTEEQTIEKQPECQIVPQKRKRGRPPKMKSTTVRAMTPDTECTGSNAETKNKVSDIVEISDKNTVTDDKQTDTVKSMENKNEEIREEPASEPKLMENSGIDNKLTAVGIAKDTSPNEDTSKHSGEGQADQQEILNNMEASVGHNDEEMNSSFMETDVVNDISPNIVDQKVNESTKCKTGHEENTKHVTLEIKDTVKEQTMGTFEKPQSQKPDHMKKARPVVTGGQRTQQPKTSVNPLENIMQAQEKLLDNPKHHLDKAQQEYFSQFKFPERHNITYHLWSLGAYNVMVRCGYHGVYKDASQKVSFLHVSPKMEYHVDYGLEQITTSEIAKEWATAYVRPNCKIVRVRINPLQSEVVSMKEEELSKMRTSAHGFNQANGFQMLANVIHRLHQCSPGQYLLHHTPGSSECQIKKSTDNNKRGSYDLHMDYFGFMGGEKTSNHIPWIPIDPNYIQQRFHKKGRIPATFEPRDYKQGMHKNKKKKKKRS